MLCFTGVIEVPLRYKSLSTEHVLSTEEIKLLKKITDKFCVELIYKRIKGRESIAKFMDELNDTGIDQDRLLTMFVNNFLTNRLKEVVHYRKEQVKKVLQKKPLFGEFN